MATELRKSRGTTLPGNVREGVAEEKSKTNQELGLFLAFVVLAAWALIASFHVVDWPAVSHALRALLVAIW